MYPHSFISAGDLLVTLPNSTKQFSIMDNLGSARTIVKIKGAAQSVKTLDYKPFGDTYDDANPERIGYEGKEKDEESSLFDYGVRQYDPALGRFLAVDPLAGKFTAINTLPSQ